MQVELYTGEIPTVFERFNELIGPLHWKKRVDLIRAEIKGNRLLKDHLFQENEMAFKLQASTDLVKKFGRFPVHQLDCSPLYPCMAFAAQILSIADALGTTQRTQLVRRVHGALKNPEDMRALRLELIAATHFLRRDLEVQWPEMIGGGTMDLVIPGLGPQGLQIECKSISEDKGRKIHRREALDFCALVGKHPANPSVNYRVRPRRSCPLKSDGGHFRWKSRSRVGAGGIIRRHSSRR